MPVTDRGARCCPSAPSPRRRTSERRGVAAQDAALSKHRGHHLALVVPDVVPAAAPIRLDVRGDVDVEVPDLSRYETEATS